MKSTAKREPGCGFSAHDGDRCDKSPHPLQSSCIRLATAGITHEKCMVMCDIFTVPMAGGAARAEQ
jgi:hypothetical protein